MKRIAEKGTVLIVEDDKLLTLVTERLLKRLGYMVTGKVQTARDAIHAVRTTDVDLILMDISLDGEMDGIEAVRRIRSFSDIPVIFLSGSSDQKTVGRARSVGMSGFLVKPVSAEDLAEPLEKVFFETPGAFEGQAINGA